MGFYGNITNTSRTSFSFDKTYSNRYDMDTSCGSDGIYAGRYVLVEYDAPQSEDTYPKYYYYDGKMYGAVNIIDTLDGNKFISSPKISTVLKNINPGLIVRVPVGFKVANPNKKSMYIRVTSENGDYTAINRTEYEDFLNHKYGEVEVTEQDFNGDELYIYDRTYPDNNGYKKVGKYYIPETLTAKQYNSLVGNSVYSSNGLWVYVENDAHGDPVNRFCALGLGGTVDDDETTPWQQWWNEHFGQYSFNFGDFDTYYLMSKYDSTKTYYKPYGNIFRVTDVTSDTYEPNIFYYYENNDKEKGQFLLSTTDKFNPGLTYYEPGVASGVYITNNQLSYTTPITVGNCYRVEGFHVYETNDTYTEYWMFTNDETWKELTFTTDTVYYTHSSGDTNYLTNFAIDTAAYGTSRGFDSTVWQKVYSSGTEKYVMVAELNSVVPTFDISVDAPTMSPITPHFDNDSTNVYYKIHWQPQWGLRTKAANNTWLGVQIRQDGGYGMNPQVQLTDDEVIYPSDSTTKWRADFYDTTSDKKTSGYYNTVTNRWDSDKEYDNSDIPAAVYFNLDGFDSDHVAYSGDLLDADQDRYNGSIAKSGWENKDAIVLAPTGKSGHLYNQHGPTIDQSAEVDTQELSIMLPSIGNTIASLWDMVFGGRATNKQISETNERNTDIQWENAKASLDRHGLRLVNEDTRDGFETDSFATAEVNTIAGAINSAHDILGMIITAGDEAGLNLRIDELDENRIYYDKTNGKYYRKHKTYDYTEKDNSDNLAFTYTEVTKEIAEEEFNPAGYYIKDADGNFIALAPDATDDPLETYYTRTGEVYGEAGELTYFDGNLYYYMDYTGSEWDEDPSLHMEMMDYIKDMKYQPGHVYYTIDPSGFTIKKLIDGYRANKYFYIADSGENKNSYVLDSNKAAVPNRIYYDIDPDKVVDITSDGFNGIYKPGTYYYWDAAQSAYRLDQSSKVTMNRTYYIPSVKKTDFTTDENGEQKIVTYVEQIDYQENIPLTREEFEKHEYYYIVNPTTQSYALYEKDWDTYCTELPTLFLKSIKYVLTDENTVTIDTNSPFTLVGFAEGAFFFEIRDAEGRLLGYKPVTIDMVDPTDATLQYKAFVNGHEGGNKYADWCEMTCPFSVKQSFVDQIDSEPIASKYACHKLSDLYFPNTYHYKDKNGSYILDTYGKMTHETYFLIDPHAIKKVEGVTFYEPYKYYAYNPETGQYDKQIGDLTAEELQTTPLYKREQLYVLHDELGILEKGAVWNPYALKEPDTVTLATRKERWELKEIPEFARGLNTMHGLLLKTNAFLEFDDTYTRDERIANGLINQLRDLLADFDKFISRNFITVDDYGRLNSTDWDTRQGHNIKIEETDDSGITNVRYEDTATKAKTYPLMKDVNGDVFEEVDDLEKMRKQWITLNLDGDALNPTLTVHHNYQHVTDTVSDFDMNAVSTDSRKMITETIETPRVDAEGNPVVDEFGNQYIDTEDITYPDPEEINGDTNQPSYVNDKEANEIELYTPKVDDMGHVVGHNIHTVRLPFNFKTYHIAAQSDAVVDLESNENVIVADNTQDNFTYATGNKWIKMAANTEDDTLTIGHEVHEFTSGAPNTQYGLAVNQVLVPSTIDPALGEAPLEEILDEDNTFEVPNFSFDEAGHITQAETHTVVLPENFTDIVVATSDEVSEDSEIGVPDTIKADSLIDTLTLTEGNRWINLEANPENDTITFKHYVKKFEQTTEAVDFNDISHPDFTVQDISWDAAGHLLSSIKTTFTLPYDFKTLSILNSGANDSNVNVAGSNGDIIATNSVDQTTFKTGNRWLTFTTDTEQKIWSLYHAPAGNATPDRTKGVHAAQTPNFGDTFKVPTVGIDEAGHVATLTESEVRIPLPSLVNGEGNTVTGLTLDAISGKLTEKKANVGTLDLAGYSLGNDYSLIKNTDTINEAFSKVQLQIKNITTFLDSNERNGSRSSITVEPNFTYKLGAPVTTLDIDFNDNDVNYYAEYRVIFITGRDNTTVSIPDTYTWDGDEPPTLVANKKYIIMTDNITHIVTISKGVSVE